MYACQRCADRGDAEERRQRAAAVLPHRRRVRPARVLVGTPREQRSWHGTFVLDCSALTRATIIAAAFYYNLHGTGNVV